MARQLVSSGVPLELIMGYSRAVRVDTQVFVSGCAPLRADMTVPATVADQARRCFEIVEKALMEAGAGLSDVVRTRVYLIDAADFGEVSRVHGELFSSVKPANTTVVVAALLDPAWRVEVEAEAIVGTNVREPTGS
jgi:enamine deaminase RidA (YjgF/YER057c/UK114 family)